MDSMACSQSSCSAVEPALDIGGSTWHSVHDAPLAVALVMSDGGSFSPDYSAQNVFSDDESCYCSVTQEGVNLVASCSSSSSNNSPAGSFLLTSVVVKVPHTGFTSPMGQAILFTSWDYPDLTAIQQFNSVRSQQDFDRLTNSRRSPTSPGPSHHSQGQAASAHGAREAQAGSAEPCVTTEGPGVSAAGGSGRSAAGVSGSGGQRINGRGSGSGGVTAGSLYSDSEQRVVQQLAWLLSHNDNLVSLLSSNCDWPTPAPQLQAALRFSGPNLASLAISPPPQQQQQLPSPPGPPPLPSTSAGAASGTAGQLPPLASHAPTSPSAAFASAPTAAPDCAPPSQPVPRLFIDMGTSTEARFALPSPVAGRYVVIKLLRAKYSNADNIDVQYIGLRGFTKPPCFASAAML